MTTHGMTRSLEYKTWVGMKQRCLSTKNKDYSQYGGRGIKVCDRWLEFENFFDDMGHKPKGMSLDRINNDGNYCKENCRWATLVEQNRNKRRSIYIEYKGVTKPLVQWCSELGLSYWLMFGRLRRGWTTEKAFTTPRLDTWSRHAK